MWSIAAVAAAAAATLGLAPALLVGGTMALAVTLAALGESVLFLWILVALSGVGFNWAEGAALTLGGNTINLGGLRWSLILAGCLILMVRADRRRLPRPLLFYAAFVTFAAVAVSWAPNRFEGIKNLLQFGAPLLIALVATNTLREQRQIGWMVNAFWAALVIGLVAMFAYVIGVPLLGLDMAEGAGLQHRGFAMWLLPMFALSLAGWRVRGPHYLWLVAGLFVVGLITVARTTLGAMLLMGLVATLARPARLRPWPVLLLALAAFAALQYGPMRGRFFANARAGFDDRLITIQGSGEDAELAIAGLNLTGRGVVWVRVFLHAQDRPVQGHGTGSATTFLKRELSGAIIHPHNDWLRVFHDQGLIGLSLMVAFAVSALLALRRVWHRAQASAVRELGLAALLALVAYLSVAVFDNSMLYVIFFTQNIFLLIALALRASELERAA